MKKIISLITVFVFAGAMFADDIETKIEGEDNIVDWTL